MTRKSKAGRHDAPQKPRKQPESLRLAGVTPSLTVNDIERSLAWYRDVLGFHVTNRWEAGPGRLYAVGLRAGTVTFILNQVDLTRGSEGRTGERFRLYGNTRQDINRLAADISARGGTLAHEPEDGPMGTRDFSVVDPDGYRISITSVGA